MTVAAVDVVVKNDGLCDKEHHQSVRIDYIETPGTTGRRMQVRSLFECPNTDNTPYHYEYFIRPPQNCTIIGVIGQEVLIQKSFAEERLPEFTFEPEGGA